MKNFPDEDEELPSVRWRRSCAKMKNFPWRDEEENPALLRLVSHGCVMRFSPGRTKTKALHGKNARVYGRKRHQVSSSRKRKREV